MDRRDVPLCNHCKHFGNLDGGCTRPIGIEWSPVYGRQERLLLRDAHGERATDKSFITRRPKCGPSGRFFEARHPLPPPPSPRR